MATFFLDPVSGSDANDGTTFANRWKTFQLGATAARIAPGDTIRIIASTDPTSLGQSATWTNNSQTVTLTSAVTTNVDTCDAAWTASTNVTATASTTTKREGTGSANLVIATAFTTGKVAFKATGTLNLSAMQQVSCMMRSSIAVASGVLTLNLCTDTIGATSVHTVPVPAMAAGVWIPVVFNNGAALNSAIASVSLNALSDPGAVTINIDNIVACKAASSADSITHASLIGKDHCLPWVASTAYTLNQKRRPTGGNRNGFQYKVTTAGTTNSSEPTWPQEIGATVTDGSVVWRCEELEDSWHPLNAINGTAITLAFDPGTANNTLARGYQGATETVATYKREPTQEQAPSTATTNTVTNAIMDSGTPGSFITFSGGWDRTAMTTQSGETWMDGRSGGGSAINTNSISRKYISIENLSSVRYNNGVIGVFDNGRLKNSHQLAHNTAGLNVNGVSTRVYLDNVALRQMGSPIVMAGGISTAVIQGRCVQIDSAANSSYGVQFSGGYNEINFMYFRGNNTSASNSGLGSNSTTAGCWLRIKNLVTANNNGLAVHGGSGEIELHNPLFGEASPIGGFNAGYDGCVSVSKYNQTAGDFRTYTDGGTIQSTTAQRNTASGLAWVFNPTSTFRGDGYPLRKVIAYVACAANVAKSVTIYTRRDSTDIMGRLMVRGGQIAGVPTDTSVDCSPTINTWVQSSTLAFTPTEDGVVEIEFHVWDGTGTTNSFYIDDLSIA